MENFIVCAVIITSRVDYFDPAGIDFFKANNERNRTLCETYLKLTTKPPE